MEGFWPKTIVMIFPTTLQVAPEPKISGVVNNDPQVAGTVANVKLAS
jgi:hypothetical protein